MKAVWMSALLLPILLLAACGTLPPKLAESGPDQALAVEVRQRLQDSGIPQRELVGVTAKDGVVTIYGSVESPALRAQIENVVKGTPGVERLERRWTR